MYAHIITALAVITLVFSGGAFGHKIYGTKICKLDGRYYCYKVKRGDSWQKLFKNKTERDIAMRVNRTNNRLHKGMVIAIPVNLKGAHMLDYAPFQKQIAATDKKKIIISLRHLAFGAYSPEGTLVYWGPISGGKSWCADVRRSCRTIKGKFAIYRKGGRWCRSSKYPVGRGGAPMPYCMFFRGGYAMHGSHDVPGYNASHGCVRLFTKDAKYLNQTFTKGERRVPVIIHK